MNTWSQYGTVTYSRLECLHPLVAAPRIDLRGVWECDYCKSANLKLRCDSCGAGIPRRYYDRTRFASY